MRKISSIGSFLGTLAFGSLFVLVGGFIIAMALDVIPTSAAEFHAPRLVIAGAGAVFVFGGLMVILQGGTRAAGGETTLARWLQFGLVFGIIFGLAALFLWTGLGDGPRTFTSESSFGGESVVSESTGRWIFGGAGVLMMIGTLAYLVFQWPGKKKKGEPEASVVAEGFPPPRDPMFPE